MALVTPNPFCNQAMSLRVEWQSLGEIRIVFANDSFFRINFFSAVKLLWVWFPPDFRCSGRLGDRFAAFAFE